MKKYIWSLLLLLGSQALWAQIQFESFKKSKHFEKSAKEKKLILVDVTANWCGWCKYMDKNIFNRRDVGKFYNQNFISVKLDADSKQGQAFSAKYEVQGLPTFLFLDEEGNLVHAVRGAVQDPSRFIEEGKKALEELNVKSPREMTDIELFAYIKKKVAEEKKYESYYKEFISRKRALQTEDNLMLSMYIYTTENKDAIAFVEQHKAIFIDQLGEELFIEANGLRAQNKVISEIESIIDDSGKIPFEELSTLTLPIYEQYLDKQEAFISANIFCLELYVELEDEEGMRKTMTYVDEGIKNKKYSGNKRVEELYSTISEFIYHLGSSKEDFEQALEWALKGSVKHKTKEKLEHLALLYEELGQDQKAEKVLLESESYEEE